MMVQGPRTRVRETLVPVLKNVAIEVVAARRRTELKLDRDQRAPW